MSIDYQCVFESSPDLYLVLKPDLTVIAASDCYLAASFTTREAIIGRNIFDVFPDNPQDPAGTSVKYLKASIEYALKNRMPHTMAVQQYDIRNLDGVFEKKFWSPLNTPVLDDNREVMFILLKVEDVTDFIRAKEDREKQTVLTDDLKRQVELMEADIYKRAQEIQRFNTELQEQVNEKTAELRAIFERISDAFVGLDTKGNFIYVNSQAENELGMNARELYGKNISDVFPPEIQGEEFLNAFKESMQNHIYRRIEIYSILYRSWFEIHFYPSPSGLSVFFRDISDRKRAEEILRSSEYKYKLLFQSNPLPMWMLDMPSRNFIAANNASTELYGYTHEEFLKMNAAEIRPREDLERFMAQSLEPHTGVRNTGTWRHLKKDGTMINVEIITHDIFYEGKPARLVLAIDITERIKAEEKLKESHEQLRQLASHLQHIREEEQKRIAREVHDELGQQVTGLKMDIAWISKKITGLDGMGAIENKLKEMTSLLDESGHTIRKIASELRPSILDDLGVIAALEWQTREFEKRFRIPVHFHTTVAYLDIDPDIATGLFRLYQESLTNVARHANAKEVVAELLVNHNFIHFNITDDGNGFDSALVENKKTLGILVMKERALMINGELEIKSKPGEGTSVSIKVPIPQEKPSFIPT